MGGGYCLCCKGELTPLINFGDQPLVNTYHVDEKFPLSVNRCVNCNHLQLHEFVDPKILYSDYAYYSDTGQTARDYFKQFARTALGYFPKAESVLDIACNDGSQLDAFLDLHLTTHGVEPDINLVGVSMAKGHWVCPYFFEDTSPDVWANKPFDIITAQNVLAHAKDPTLFMQMCAHIMHEDSFLFIQTSQANMIVNGECDTIYHEHISYFNSWSMRKLANRCGLRLVDILLPSIHGTSYVFVLSKNVLWNRRVMDRCEWEGIVGMRHESLYNWWVSHVRHKLRWVKETVEKYQTEGYCTVGCGAAAKGISMLNMAGVKLDVIIDTTPSKWNKTTSGMRIIRFDELKNLTEKKILFVVLAWNLASEIKKNVLALRDRPGDEFIEIK